MSTIPVPKILECSQFIAKSNMKAERTVMDYELDFYISGNRRMIIDDKEHSISMGSLVFRKPGQHVVSYGDYNCYILTMDLSGEVNISPSRYLRTRRGEFQKKTSHILLDDFPTVFTPKHYEEILGLFEKINVNTYPFPENKERAKNALQQLLLLVSSDIVSISTIQKPKQVHEDYIKKICGYINKNYQNTIAINDLANFVSLNPNYLIRVFKSKTNTTPTQYLNEIRLFHAQRMLCESSIPITEISYRCGFTSSAYFTKQFKKKFGKTPSEFRR